MINMKIMRSDCFAHQKFLLIIFGFLPSQNIFYQLYSFSLLTALTIYPFLVIPEVTKLYYNDFKEFIFALLFELGNFTCVFVIQCTFWKRSELKKLFENFQQLEELADLQNTGEEIEFLKPYKNIVVKQSYVGSSAAIFVLISYPLASIALSLNKEKWILPFGSGPAINNNNIQFMLQTLLFGTSCVILYLLVFLYINILTIICGHCKLLQKYIVTSFTGHAGQIFKECNAKLIKSKIIDWESFKVQLKHIVPYHTGIIDAADQMETIFSNGMLSFFGGTSICLCLLIYHSELNLTIADYAKDIIALVIAYIMLILISNYGEKTATESSKIASICYEIDFENCDLRIQKSLILIMVRSQRPITPTMGKVKILNLRTMLSVFQSIYTYYTFLKNMKNK